MKSRAYQALGLEGGRIAMRYLAGTTQAVNQSGLEDSREISDLRIEQFRKCSFFILIALR